MLEDAELIVRLRAFQFAEGCSIMGRVRVFSSSIRKWIYAK